MRVWYHGDPEPEDRPPVVDDDSVTWEWMEIDEGEWLWVQLGVTINGNFGEGPKMRFWSQLTEEYGPLREVGPEGVRDSYVRTP